MTCRGLCDTPTIRDNYVTHSSRIPNGYYLGFRLCNMCNLSYKTKESHCPCCGQALRTNPRSAINGSKDRYNKKMGIKRI